MRIDLTLAVICDGFLLLISLIIIGKVIGDGNFTLAPLSPSHAPSSFTGLSLALAFGDPDLPRLRAVASCSGEEVTDPHGNVPKAIYTALALIGGVLFLATFAMILGFGSHGIGRLNDLVASQGTPWFALVKSRIGQGWVDVLEVLIVLSILSNTIASTNSVVRIQYGMGRARALPRQLGWTLPGRRTPYVAIGLTMAPGPGDHAVRGLVWIADFAVRVHRLRDRLRRGRRVHPDRRGGDRATSTRSPTAAGVVPQLGRADRRDRDPAAGRLHVVLSRPRLPAQVGAADRDRLADRRRRLPRLARARPGSRSTSTTRSRRSARTIPPEALATEPKTA